MYRIYLFCLAVFAVSCTKATDDSNGTTTETATIYGVWEGYYTYVPYPNQMFRYAIHTDGTIVNTSSAANFYNINTGTWQLQGDSLIVYTTCVNGEPNSIGVKEVQTAKWDKVNGTLTGTWSFLPPLNGGGTFSLTKKK